jgi:carbamate kinase
MNTVAEPVRAARTSRAAQALPARDHRVVIAFGGNAAYPPSIKGLASEQLELMRRACEHLVDIVAAGYQVVLTHGNGPVVGNILFRMARTANELPPMPMDICVSHSQGGIGYMLQQTLANVLTRHGVKREVAALVTQVEVDPADPAFTHPTKPVGRFFSQEDADKLTSEQGWQFVEDSGRGWRRVVPSPQPRRIVELASMQALLAAGVIPVTVGGGGIPVARDSEGCLYGLSAVIDKDLTSAMLAAQLGAQTLVMLTGVDRVAVDFGKPSQRAIAVMTAEEARRHQADGQFPPGSMGPKIDAALRYLDAGGREVIITSIEHLRDALQGEGGTRIVP